MKRKSTILSLRLANIIKYFEINTLVNQFFKIAANLYKGFLFLFVVPPLKKSILKLILNGPTNALYINSYIHVCILIFLLLNSFLNKRILSKII